MTIGDPFVSHLFFVHSLLFTFGFDVLSSSDPNVCGMDDPTTPVGDIFSRNTRMQQSMRHENATKCSRNTKPSSAGW